MCYLNLISPGGIYNPMLNSNREQVGPLLIEYLAHFPCGTFQHGHVYHVKLRAFALLIL